MRFETKKKSSVTLVESFAVWDNSREHANVFSWGRDCKVSMTQKHRD